MAEPFVFDAWAGMTEGALKNRVRSLSRGLAEWQRIAHLLGLMAPEAVEKLHPMYRDRVQSLIEAYRDEPDGDELT